MESIPIEEFQSELQGNILTPYLGAHCGRMFLVRFVEQDPAELRKWLQSLLDKISFGIDHERDRRCFVNVAFSYAGLRALGVDPTDLEGFPEAFKQGMLARAEYLGDPKSSPEESSLLDAPCWQESEPDALVLVHARPSRSLLTRLQQLGGAARAASELDRFEPPHANGDFDELKQFLDEEVGRVLGDAWPGPGIRIETQDLHHLLDDNEQPIEYFGFRDGIGQPQVLDPNGQQGREAGLWNRFVRDRRAPPLQTFGSYLVVRKLAQDAGRFWNQMHAQSRPPNVSARQLAEHVVGRRMDGARLDGKHSNGGIEVAAFDPGAGDARCPFHSHVRRVNPQIDSDPDANPRLIRRSVSYVDRNSSGLMFMAYNADIEQQFEFVQRNWVQRGNHVGLTSKHIDAFAGVPVEDGHNGIPSVNFKTRIGDDDLALTLASAVSYRGGGYFFAPSSTALRRIAGMPFAKAPQRAVAAGEPAVSAALAACRSDEQRLMLVQGWIDKPGPGGSFWRYVDGLGSKTLTIDKTVFVADQRLCREVLLDDGTRFSVREYGHRMRRTFGNFMLGMDKPAHDLEYRANRIIPSANLYGPFHEQKQLQRLQAVQTSARAAATALLERARLGAVPAHIRVADLMAVVLGRVAAEYFGMTELSNGALLTWSGLIAKRHFRFKTDDFDDANARAASDQLLNHVLSLIAAVREQQREGTLHGKPEHDPAVQLRALLDDIQDALEHPVGDDVASGPSGRVNDHDLARNLIGITLGSMAASAKAVGEALGFHAAALSREPATRSTWEYDRMARQLSTDADPTAPNALYALLVERCLHAARRGSLDSVYRVYRGPQPFSWNDVHITEGQMVVVWLGGATDVDDVDALFGAGIHKCPGMDMAKAIINGALQSVVLQGLQPEISDGELTLAPRPQHGARA